MYFIYLFGLTIVGLLIKLVLIVGGGAILYGGWREWKPMYRIGPGRKLQKKLGPDGARIATIAIGGSIAFVGIYWLISSIGG